MTHTPRDARYAGIMTLMYTLSAVVAVIMIAYLVAPAEMARFSLAHGLDLAEPTFPTGYAGLAELMLR